MTGLTEFQRMQLDAHYASNRAAELGLTAQDIRSMPWDEYNRLFGTAGRQTPAEAARAAFEAQHEQPPAPAAPQSAPQPPESEPVGIDVNSPEFFHAWRSQRTSGGEGKGIFDSVGSQSAEYRAAAARHAGRTGWSQSNVVESPKIARAFVDQDAHRDTRSLADRFGVPGQAWVPGS